MISNLMKNLAICLGLILSLNQGLGHAAEAPGKTEISSFLSGVATLLDQQNQSAALRDQLGFILNQLEYTADFNRTGSILVGEKKFAAMSPTERNRLRVYFAEHLRQYFVVRLIKARQDQLDGIARLLRDRTAREYLGLTLEEVQAMQGKPMSFEINELKDTATAFGPGIYSVILPAPELTHRMIDKGVSRRSDVELPVEWVLRNGQAHLVDVNAGGSHPIAAEVEAIRSFLKSSSQNPVETYANTLTRKFSLSTAHVALIEELAKSLSK